MRQQWIMALFYCKHNKKSKKIIYLIYDIRFENKNSLISVLECLSLSRVSDYFNHGTHFRAFSDKW